MNSVVNDPHHSPKMSDVIRTEKHRVQRSFFDHATGKAYPSIAEIPGRRELDPSTLPIFLRIGYVPGNATLFRGVDCLPGGCTVRVRDGTWSVETRFRFKDHIDPDEVAARSESELIERGTKLLLTAVDRCRDGSEVIVPLSGGLDSRTVLGALLETMPARSITTYTYGLRGTLDFEIGNEVARRAGTRHVTLDLERRGFSEENVLRTAILSDANTELMKPAVWIHVIEEFGDRAQYWSGFTGDGVAGSHYLPHRGDLDQAVADFVSDETRSLQYLEDGEWSREHMRAVARVTKYDGLLSNHEAVWFENHVERYTAHHIFLRGLRYALPFMDDEFAGFMLALPSRLRSGKRLFDRMVSERFKSLFALPSKDYGYSLTGRSLQHRAWQANQAVRKVLWRVMPTSVTHPRTSYLDFATAIRERPAVRSMVVGAIASLAKRQILDERRLERMLNDHLRSARDTSSLLTLLTSLELALRALCDHEPSTRGSVVL